MLRIISVLSACLFALAACAPVDTQLNQTRASDGTTAPKLYRIRQGDVSKIQFRMLDSVNSLRSAAGVGPLAFDSKLNAAAATHARDMSVQNRPWHFGSDGSSPIQRVARVGYNGAFLGETISETYESELETLGAWMGQEDTRRVILSPAARNMGFSWHQESNGKIWWTLITGS